MSNENLSNVSNVNVNIEAAKCLEVLFDNLKELASDAYGFLGLISPEIPSFIAQRRAICLINVLKATQNKLTKAGLSNEQLKHCSLKLGIPIIENASLEEEPSLQDIWANLLANTLNPNYETELSPIFINIIKQLTVFDAKLLQTFNFNAAQPNPIVYRDQYSADLWTGHDYEIVSRAKISSSFEILASMSLFNNIAISDSTILRNSAVLTRTSYRLTELGESFINSCIDDAGNRTVKTPMTNNNETK